MADLVGFVASITGIVAFAVSVANTLDNLIKDIQEAPSSLSTLRIQVKAFSDASANVARALKASGAAPTTINTYSAQLWEAMRGGDVILRQLHNEMAEIRSSKPLRQPDGKIREMTLRERVMFKWNEPQIKKWTDALDTHCSVFLLLLYSQAILRDGFVDANLEPVDLPELQSPRSAQESGQADGPSLATKDWEKIGEDFEGMPDDNSEPRTSMSTHTDPQSSSSGPGPQPPAKKWFWSFGKKSSNAKTLKPAIKVEKLADMPVDSAKESVKRYQEMLSADSRNLVPDCPKFRVVLLGKTGEGKTTLYSRVLGVTYEKKNKLHGDRTPAKKIWEPIEFSGKNDSLLLHDSGGFEAGGESILQEAKDFVEAKQSVKLADQIHCIWYLISCDSPRPVQVIDEQFFAGKLMNTGEIPVFVVFTKYDLLVKKIRDEAEPGATEESIERSAFEYFKTNLESGIKPFIKDQSKVSICRVGIKEGAEEYFPSHYKDGEPFGSQDLVDQMSSQLQGGHLQILWIATQQRDDQTKLIQSITRSMALFWRARRISSYSYIPFMCLVGIEGVYYSALDVAKSHWQIQNWEKSTEAVRAIFDIEGIELFFAIGFLFYNVVGPYSLPLISEMALKIIIGTNLIGRRLFLEEQKLPEGQKLSPEQVRAEIKKFRKSEDRTRMMKAIAEARMDKIDYKKEDRMEQVIEVARRAIEAAVGLADESFFTMERLKLFRDISQGDSSNN